jgi:hypothetical protein
MLIVIMWEMLLLRIQPNFQKSKVNCLLCILVFDRIKKVHHSDDGGEHKVSPLRTVVVMNPKSGQILSSAL